MITLSRSRRRSIARRRRRKRRKRWRRRRWRRRKRKKEDRISKNGDEFVSHFLALTRTF